MPKGTILITGGTGLVGKRLTEILQENGYKVSYLSREKDGSSSVETYAWDIPKGKIDDKAISTADYIINLAGASLLEKRWTKKYKKVIIDSRVDSVHLLHKALKTIPNNVQAVVSASAVGYYSSDTGNQLIDETCPSGDDFLSEVVVKWEKAVEQLNELTIRTVELRIGIVFSDRGGALQQLKAPIRWYVGAPIGTGKQYMSWIHIDDLCGMFLKAIQDNQLSGVYNAVAPEPATNKEITHAIAKAMGKPIFLPNVPGFIMKLLFGSEKAEMLLGGNKVTPAKMIGVGFKFKFPNLRQALDNLVQK